ncbi:MAG TPA: deoxycytidylate deaminase [Actinobacteria bacterium]|nr:deoxycytidylate deaminase [Actinomycetota bacterium]
MKQVLLYLPVLHAGYEQFFSRHSDAGEILVLGEGFRREYPGMAKDIRALPPPRAAGYLRLIAPQAHIRVIEPADLPAAVSGSEIVMPDEEITRDLAGRHDLGRGRKVVFDRTFLRWDRTWATTRAPVTFDGEICATDLARELLGTADATAQRSSDWWRQVGAVAARAGQVLGCAWNQHRPTEYAPYLNGDPRDGFGRGVRADLSTAIHAEAALVARAARDGLSLAGADLYTTTFPCPACARLVAEAGFRRCYFTGQYSVLDGEQVLRAAGIRLIWVDTVTTGPASQGVS